MTRRAVEHKCGQQSVVGGWRLLGTATHSRLEAERGLIAGATCKRASKVVVGGDSMIVSQSASGYAWLSASCVLCVMCAVQAASYRLRRTQKTASFQQSHLSCTGANDKKMEVQQTVISKTSEHTQ